ncbi:ECF RNA polymerase sigma factor SigW [Paraliobacillus sp. PM-2]|uniref:RNA polymerase sigma factor n=1 Tax=Paraliobacillus sp. PM-2 TaxID=1462524 RepID=UPI00061CB56A|nr:RNA polymerase sigma factor [Paraliobacillus sp. PM-2]CQR47876.1 ECF RNA polymerase sigma factor SigW [Paraliobacillus sp. PM-2]
MVTLETSGGETGAFNNYFQLYYKEMVAVATHITKDCYLAEDVVQEAFIKAYRHQKNIEDTSKWKYWIKTIVKRTAIDTLRKQQRFQTLSADHWIDNHIAGLNDSCSFVEEAMEKNFMYQQIITIIDQLNPSLKNVLFLKIYFDLCDKEIAEKLNISISAVKTRLYRARIKLRKDIKQHSKTSIPKWLEVS